MVKNDDNNGRFYQWYHAIKTHIHNLVYMHIRYEWWSCSLALINVDGCKRKARNRRYCRIIQDIEEQLVHISCLVEVRASCDAEDSAIKECRRLATSIRMDNRGKKKRSPKGSMLDDIMEQSEKRKWFSGQKWSFCLHGKLLLHESNEHVSIVPNFLSTVSYWIIFRLSIKLISPIKKCKQK